MRLLRLLGFVTVLSLSSVSCVDSAPEQLGKSLQALCGNITGSATATQAHAETLSPNRRLLIPPLIGSNYTQVPVVGASLARLTLRREHHAIECYYNLVSRYVFSYCAPASFTSGDAFETGSWELELLTVDTPSRTATAVLTDTGPETACTSSGCIPMSAGTSCGAPDSCSTSGICTVAGTCVPDSLIDPDDFDACTVDTCDPAAGPVNTPCTEIEPGITTTLAAATEFLYTNPSPSQTGMLATLAPETAAVIVGHVLDDDGYGLANVTVRVVGQSDLGQTKTDAHGEFMLAVRGGASATLEYRAASYLPAQRTVEPPWQDYVRAPTVVLKTLDPNSLAVTLSSVSGIAVLEGSAINDGDGERQAVLMVPQGITAEMRLPSGLTTPIDELTLRATEYTEGALGQEAMPGALPEASGYTYAVELSADEAIAAGASSVTFSEPLIFYLENFLDFPTGGIVPVGYYDFELQRWNPSDNGLVIMILDDSPLEIDLDGNGIAATPQELADAGFSTAELSEIASRYTINDTLWRVEIPHLTPWDCNWPYGPGDDDCIPFSGAECESNGGGGGGGDDDPNHERNEDDSCEEEGSVIECHNQTLGKTIALSGTPYTLNYRSDRVPGRESAYQLDVPVTGPGLPDSLMSIEYSIHVAGRSFTDTIDCSQTPCPLNHTVPFTWDGLDLFGRELRGKQPVSVELSYEYPAVYREPAEAAMAFAAFGGAPLSNDEARATYKVGKPRWNGSIGAWDALGQAELGGWTLSVHHAYDVLDGTLYLGTGDRRQAAEAAAVVQTAVAVSASTAISVTSAPDTGYYFSQDSLGGSGPQIWYVSPTGTQVLVAGCPTASVCPEPSEGDPAVGSELVNPKRPKVGPDGLLYFLAPRFGAGAGSSPTTLRRINPDGTLQTIVGGSASSPFPGDGDDAYPSWVGVIRGFDFGADGTIYLASQQRAVYRVTDGRIYRVAGDPSVAGTYSGDGGPARDALFNALFALATGPDGSIYVAERGTNDCRVRRIDKGGTINLFAGDGPCLSTGVVPTQDGGLATGTSLHEIDDLAVAPNGQVYILGDERFLRRVTPRGYIYEVSGYDGNGSGCPDFFCGELGPAASAKWNAARYLDVEADGDVIVGLRTIARIGSAYPRLGGSLIVPNVEATEAYVFDSAGRHLSTRDLMTGATLFAFDYTDGRLTKVTDQHGNETLIVRDASGNAMAIEGPFGDATNVSMDANGWLNTVENPANEMIELTSSSDGLLTAYRTAENQWSYYEYELGTGRLIGKDDPLLEELTLARTSIPSGWEVTFTDEENVPTTYRVTRSADGTETRTSFFPHGLVTQRTRNLADGTTVVTADGMTHTSVLSPDPRFGMLAPIHSKTTTESPGSPSIVARIERTRDIVTDPNDPFDVVSWIEQFVVTDGVTDNVLTRTYDPLTRTLLETTPEGRIRTYQYDSSGRLIRTQFGNDLPVERTYNSYGQLSEVSYDNGTPLRVTTYAYDELSVATPFLTSMVDAELQTTTYARDEVGRLLSLLRPDGQSVVYEYDNNGNRTKVTPPGKRAHLESYDAVDSMVGYLPPDVDGAPNQFGTTYVYNGDRTLAQELLPGRTINYSYASGRLSQVSFNTGAIDIGYSVAGTLNSYSGPDTIDLTFGHDGSYETSVSWSGGLSSGLVREFDAFGRLWIEQVGAEPPIVYEYDADGLLETVGVTGTDALTYGRHLDSGRVTSAVVGEIIESRTYNPFGELETYSVVHDSTLIYQLILDYDDLGRIESKSEQVYPAPIPTTTDYTYDGAGRLMTVDGASPIADYGYDANGNRTSEAVSAISGTYDAQDRIVSWGGSTFTHTDSGEVLTKSDGFTTYTYSYDAQGSLLSVDDGTDTWTYEYDGIGRLTTRSENTTHEFSLLWRSDLQPIARLDASDAVEQLYVHGEDINVPELIVEGSTVYRVIKDHLGSVRLVVDVGPAPMLVMQRMQHDEWGVVTVDTAPGAQPFGFAGGLYDPDTGLVRFGERDYDASIGRWLAKDPLRFDQSDGPNLYLYVRGNPINMIDPSGTEGFDFGDLFCVLHSYLCMNLGCNDEQKKPKCPSKETCAAKLETCNKYFGTPMCDGPYCGKYPDKCCETEYDKCMKCLAHDLTSDGPCK